jgi:hypothetical protein
MLARGQRTLSRRGYPRPRRTSGHRSRCLRFGGSSFGRFSRRFLLRQLVEMLANELRMREIERTGVRLFFCDADLGQVLDQHFGLDLEFPGQLVNSNLIRI